MIVLDEVVNRKIENNIKNMKNKRIWFKDLIKV